MANNALAPAAPGGRGVRLLAACESYELVLDFFGPWFRPDGRRDHKMPDCKNLLWELEDLIADVLGYNDRQNDRVVLNKHESHRTYCLVSLNRCPHRIQGQ